MNSSNESQNAAIAGGHGALENKTAYFDLSQRIVAYSMSQSQKEIPLVGFNYEPDITAFWEEYLQLNRTRTHARKISFNTLMLKLVSECLKAAPVLNARLAYDDKASTGKLNYQGQVDISMPTILPDGRMFPLKVRNVESKSLDELSEYIYDLLSRLNNTMIDEVLYELAIERNWQDLKRGKLLEVLARIFATYIGEHRLTRAPRHERHRYKHSVSANAVLTTEDVGEGSVSVTNWGSLYKNLRGSCTIAPLIPPTVFSNAISAVQEQLYPYQDAEGHIQIGIKKILPITLLFDHRIGGFGDLVPYIKQMDEIFANPSLIHRW